MKIAILEQRKDDETGTGTRGRAMGRFLRDHGHHVDVLAPSPQRLADFARFRFSLWSRLKRRALSRGALPHLWDFITSELEPRLRAGEYDAVIARLQPVAHVLTRDLSCLKIVDVANIGFLEAYYSGGIDRNELADYHRREMAIYRAADHILSPHEEWEQFFRRHVYDDPKIVTVRLGCDPASRTARYAAPPRMVYAGSYDYIQDPYLLALLAGQSPFQIDCYGTVDPNYDFLPSRLHYCGFKPTLDFLADYQVGVITVARDRLREYSPATKFPYYFAAGLPVLFPSWMKEGHLYDAAVPYDDEEDFVRQARRMTSNEGEWTRLSANALRIGSELTWDRVLTPLLDILHAA